MVGEKESIDITRDEIEELKAKIVKEKVWFVPTLHGKYLTAEEPQ